MIYSSLCQRSRFKIYMLMYMGVFSLYDRTTCHGRWTTVECCISVHDCVLHSKGDFIRVGSVAFETELILFILEGENMLFDLNANKISNANFWNFERVKCSPPLFFWLVCNKWNDMNLHSLYLFFFFIKKLYSIIIVNTRDCLLVLNVGFSKRVEFS